MRTIRMMLAAAVALLSGSAAFATAPDAPTGVVASTNDTECIQLSWTQVPGAAYYIVYRYGGNTTQTGLEQFRVTGRSFSDTSCEAGMQIPYRVRAFNSQNEGGGYSTYVRGYRRPILDARIGGSRSFNPLGSAGPAHSLKVKCNVKWTAATTNSWIQLEQGAFKGTNDVEDLNFDLAENTTGEPRCGTITVRAGTESDELTVWQGAVPVDGQTVWNGDSALAIVEEAACSNDFRICENERGLFLTVYDNEAVGGSCLRTTPIVKGQRAVIAWPVPKDRKVTFSWRKDTSNSGDSFKVYEGDFTSSGAPDIANARLIATCSATYWRTVTIGGSYNARPGIFFVFEKTNGCAPDSSRGFGFIDNVSFETNPVGLAFRDPVTGTSGNYKLKIGEEDEATVITEAIQSHQVYYGGEWHEVRKRVSPDWSWRSGSNGLAGVHRGEGEDGGDLVFIQGVPTDEACSVWRVSYTVEGTTVSENLSVSGMPRISDALDCDQLSGREWNGWTLDTSDYTAVGNDSASSGVPEIGKARRLVATFTGSGVIRFNYKVPGLAPGETATFGIDGHVCGSLEDAYGWMEASVYVGEVGTHTIFWEYARSPGILSAGQGMRVDHLTIEDLPASLIVSGGGESPTGGPPLEIIDHLFADCAYAPDGFSLTARSGEWLDTSAAAELSEGVYGFAFSAVKNETGEPRSDWLRLVVGGVTNDILVVQAAGLDPTLDSVFVDNRYINAAADSATQLSATLYFMDGTIAENFTDLLWEHDFGDMVTIENGLMTVGEVDAVYDGGVTVRLGDKFDWSSVTLHPGISALAPEGVTLASDSWAVDNVAWYSEDLCVRTAYAYSPTLWDQEKLTATMEGPGVFGCRWKVSSNQNVDWLCVYIDGKLIDRISGTEGDWEDLSLPIPEGEHTVMFEYAKATITLFGGDDTAYVRDFTFVPCTPTGELRVVGPAALRSGEIATYSLVKVCTNEAQGVGMEAVFPLEGEERVTFTATDARTRAAVSSTVVDGEVRVKVPFAVEWADTGSLTIEADDDGTPLQASAPITIVPLLIKDVLDVTSPALSSFTVPDDSYGDVEVVENVLGSTSCLRMTAPGGRWMTARLEMLVMDAGSLQFNYCLKEGQVGIGETISSLVVNVDGDEAARCHGSPTDNSWSSLMQPITIESSGPHIVSFEFAACTGDAENAELLLDSLVWTPSGSGMTTIIGGVIDGPSELGASEFEIQLPYYVQGRGSDWVVHDYEMAPQYTSVEVLSGDEEHVGGYFWRGSFCIYALEEVTTDTVVRVRAYNTVTGVSADAEKTVVVRARIPVYKAIFDEGLYDNCWIMDGMDHGWTGTGTGACVGESCARTTELDDGEEAELYLVAYGAGTLEFDWKVSSAVGDKFSFECSEAEDQEVMPIMGTGAGWQHVSITFTNAVDASGENPVERIFRWSYLKNLDGQTAGEDCAWLDNVTWNGSSPTGIDYAYLNLPWELTPGSYIVGNVLFYRKINERKYEIEQQQQQGDQDQGDVERLPATDEPLPKVTWNVDFDMNPQLEDVVSYYFDGSGNIVISLPNDCLDAGSFYVEASYTLDGEPIVERSEVCLFGGGPLMMMAAAKAATPSGVPYTWLARQGGSGLTEKALAATEKKLAANGVNTLQECYVAGLDPSDENSEFKADITITNGVPYITWTPSIPDRKYTIMGKASLSDPEWVTPTNSTHRFFKVMIDLK